MTWSAENKRNMYFQCVPEKLLENLCFYYFLDLLNG